MRWMEPSHRAAAVKFLATADTLTGTASQELIIPRRPVEASEPASSRRASVT
jgi:hypothetical protein